MQTLDGMITPAQLERQINLLVINAARESGELEGLHGLGFHKTFKRVGKRLKKVVKKTLTVVKKVAPVVAAGAALWYGAPYIAAAAKSVGGAVLPLFTGGGAGTAQSATAPEITDAATQRATEMAAAQGVGLNSPEAQQMLRGYIQYQQQKIQNKAQSQVGPPTSNQYGGFVQQGFDSRGRQGYPTSGYPSSGYPSSGYPQAKPAMPAWAIPAAIAAAGVVALPLLMR